MTTRARSFRYVGLDVDRDSLSAHYQLDDAAFTEEVTFEGVGALDEAPVRAVAHLWYLIAGLSYFKAGAPPRIDLGDTPVGPRGRRLLSAALVDGLAEFSWRNDLPLTDVELTGGVEADAHVATLDELRVLTPFGGGIDSVVTVEHLSGELDQALFVLSPIGGRFAALEATAAVTGLDVVRATRALDSKLLQRTPGFFEGHVPVTAMVSLLATVAALASGRGGVVMSNEHSASAANLRWREREVNHQWSKSWVAEQLIGDAIAELVGVGLTNASFLRDRSEVWVAERFSALIDYHPVFRSCNRAFAQDAGRRAGTWCGECDKCLFINLMLAPFLSRASLRAIFGAEPLGDPRRESQLRTLVGIGLDHKPFECVGDPGESAVALARVVQLPEWRDDARLGEIARLAGPERSLAELLEPEGPSRAPAHWLR